MVSLTIRYILFFSRIGDANLKQNVIKNDVHFTKYTIESLKLNNDINLRWTVSD